jgi:hypothetical protein
MRLSMSRALVAGAFLICLMAAMAVAAATPALADRAYPSQHIPLASVDGEQIDTEFVENIHVNGPQIFALERYVLVGASPTTEYQVTIKIYGDPGATMSLGALPTVAFGTNAVGNGVGRFTLPLSGVDQGLHGLTLHLVWELSVGGAVAYHSPISMVVLD